MVHLVHDSHRLVRHDRLLRFPQVAAIVGLRKTTIYSLMQRGEFPQSVRLTTKAVAWPESAVLKWVQERVAGTAGLPGADPGGSSAKHREGRA